LKPTVKLAETQTPDGARLALYEHDGEYCIRVGQEELMHSSHSISELLLGELATEQLTAHANPTVLIGGLGRHSSCGRVDARRRRVEPEVSHRPERISAR
jgi:hypothetical protein